MSAIRCFCFGMLATVIGLGAGTACAQGPIQDATTALSLGQHTASATAGFHRYGYGRYGFYGFRGAGWGYAYARPQLYVTSRYPAYNYAWTAARPYYSPYVANPYAVSPYVVPQYYSPYAYGSVYAPSYVYRQAYTYPMGYYRYGYYTNPSIAAFAYPYGYPGGYSMRGIVIYGN